MTAEATSTRAPAPRPPGPDSAGAVRQQAEQILTANGVEAAQSAPPLDDGAEAVEVRRLRLTPASQITPRVTRWAWDTAPSEAPPAERQGRLPAGSLVIGAGHAGLGKSQFAVWLAAQISRGTLPGCWHGTPRNVIYVASEDSYSMTVVPRLMAAGADLNRVFRAEVEHITGAHGCLSLPVDTDRLGEAVAARDVALVVCDPLLSMLDSGLNDYKAKEVRNALEPLVAMADRTRCLVFGLAHFTKATGNNPLNQVAGSGAFGQLVRAGIGFVRDSDGALIMSQIKNNLGREDLPSLLYEIEARTVETDEGPSYVSRFRFTGKESPVSVGEVLSDQENGPEVRGERDEAVAWLTGYLADQGGEASAAEIIKAARADGFSPSTLRRARDRAGVKFQRRGFAGGSVWILNPSATHSAHSGQRPACEPNDPNADPNGATEERPAEQDAAAPESFGSRSAQSGLHTQGDLNELNGSNEP